MIGIASIQSATDACVRTAQRGLGAAVECVSSGIQSCTSSSLGMLGVGSFAPLDECIEYGMSEIEARTRMAPVRSFASLRLIQLSSAIATAIDTAPDGASAPSSLDSSESSVGRSLEDVILLAEETVASRTIFETDPQARSTLLNIEKFGEIALVRGFEGAAATIEV